jgi:hypothetical protein
MRMIRRAALIVSMLLLGAGLAACGSGSSDATATGDSARPAVAPPEPALKRCPRQSPELSGETPGTRGRVVRRTPSSAVVCRWRTDEDGELVEAEGVVSGRRLDPLVRALNSLPPGRLGDFECESGLNLSYLIGFRFGDGSGTEVEADYSACGAVRTRGHFWGIDGKVRERLEALLTPP